MNLANHMLRSARAFPGRPAVALGSVTLHTYGSLAARVARLAGALNRTCELCPGDRVALAMKNCPEYLEIL